MSENNSNSYNSQTLARKLSMIFVSVALLGILICTGLLTFTLLNQQAMFELPASSPFNTEISYLGFSCFIFYLVGVALLFIAYFAIDLIQVKRRLFALCVFSIGSCTIFFSIAASFFFGINPWWKNLSMIFIASQGASTCILIFSSILLKFSINNVANALQVIAIISLITTSTLEIFNYSK